MGRDTCISHGAKEIYLVLRNDYRRLMSGDSVAAALLSVFEYWANGAIAGDSKLAKAASLCVGSRSILEFETMLIGIASDKRIRQGLKKLAEHGFISMTGKATDGRPKTYWFLIEAVQTTLDNLGQSPDLTSIRQPRLIARPPSVIQPTEPRLIARPSSVNCPTPLGNPTDRTSVIQPTEPRSIDQTSIYKNSFKEDQKEIKKERDQSDFAAATSAIAIAPSEKLQEQEESQAKESTATDRQPRSPSGAIGKRKVPRPRRKQKTMPEFEPEAFEAWWESYRTFCLEVEAGYGSREEAAAAWDELIGGAVDLGAILQAEETALGLIREGTDFYIGAKVKQKQAKGEAIGVAHGVRYLRDRKWYEALEHKRRKAVSSEAHPSHASLRVFVWTDWHPEDDSPTDLSAELDIVKYCWVELKLTWDDPRWLMWLQKARERSPFEWQSKGYGFAHLPDWALRHLAHDMQIPFGGG